MNTDTRFLFESFYEENPEAFNDGPLLIAGVKSSREVAVSGRFRDLGQRVVIAEPWPANVEIAKAFHPHAEVVQGLVQDVPGLSEFRTLVWLQGPEHVETPTVKAFLRTLMETVELIVLEMPHGIHLQGADGGNHHEVHISHWYERDFADMGPGWELYPSHEGMPGDEALDIRHLLAVWRK